MLAVVDFIANGVEQAENGAAAEPGYIEIFDPLNQYMSL